MLLTVDFTSSKAEVQLILLQAKLLRVGFAIPCFAETHNMLMLYFITLLSSVRNYC